MLSKEEINRYSRHIILPEIGIEGQEKLKQAKVLVVGAGGLGCPVLLYLCASGVGTIGIMDFDVVEEINLQRQILFTQDDIGKSKAVMAGERLSKMNSNCKLQIVNCKLTKENAAEIISQYDFVVDGTDNFLAKYLLNDVCVILKKPLVFGSVYKFEGQVSVFNYHNGPTYRCLFPDPPPTASFNCSDVGIMGILPGIIGTLQANEAIKIITGVGDVLSGKLIVFDALSLLFRIIEFQKVTF
ncbi:MAG: HesA/MoeB/ThiF family protein [Bacteroidota bacterium]